MSYTKYGPFTDGSSPGISASFLNSLESYLRQNTGATETGKYFLAGSIYTNNALVSDFLRTISQGTTISSVTIDTTDQAPTGGMTATPSIGGLGNGGFQAYSLATTGPNTNGRCGGSWTAQF